MALWLPGGFRAETETQVKRSRFIATLARVDDEDQARAVIAEVRRLRPDARHHCTAFIVEVPGAQRVERSSDDGEPAGTAGMPMLEVLRGAGVSQAVVVVTRYFGGVLLGTGGLVRAYSEAVSGALAGVALVRPVRRPLYALSVRHDEFGRVQGALIRAGLTVVETRFAERAELVVAAPAEVDVEPILGRIVRGAELPVRRVGESLIEVPA